MPLFTHNYKIMMLYASINQGNGIQRLERSTKLELPDLHKLMTENIRIVGKAFSDPAIDLFCDDNFLAKKLPISCITRSNTIFCGSVIAAACDVNSSTFLLPLTETQFEIVVNELIGIVNLTDNLLALAYFKTHPPKQF